MWRKQDFDSSFSWEEQAFAEDSAAVWPPRSYSCSFCRREFTSAQALGGHMNVHRRDRARLKRSPTRFRNRLPNPNPSPGRASDYSETTGKEGMNLRLSCPRVTDKDRVGIGILDDGSSSLLNFDFGRPRPASGLVDDDHSREEETGTVVGGCKRRKTDEETTIQFYVKSSSLVERSNHHQHHHHSMIQSEVIGVSSSSLHDLDLELRLGGLSKG